MNHVAASHHAASPIALNLIAVNQNAVRSTTPHHAPVPIAVPRLVAAPLAAVPLVPVWGVQGRGALGVAEEPRPALLPSQPPGATNRQRDAARSVAHRSFVVAWALREGRPPVLVVAGSVEQLPPVPSPTAPNDSCPVRHSYRLLFVTLTLTGGPQEWAAPGS